MTSKKERNIPQLNTVYKNLRGVNKTGRQKPLNELKIPAYFFQAII